MFQVRRAALVRAQLLAKKGCSDEALKCLQTAQEIARQFHDVPLDAAAQLQMAQVLGKARDYKAASRRLLEAERQEITTIRELQASYYYGASHVLSDLEISLKQHLHDRALRLWAEQGVVSVRFEIDDFPFSTPQTGDTHQTNPYTVECVTDSLAAFVDLAYRPRLLGEEMLSAIDGLACSPASKVIETRSEAESPKAEDDTVTLPLGTDRGKGNLTLVCKLPDDPVKAVLLADVLRIGRAAIALERAREDAMHAAGIHRVMRQRTVFEQVLELAAVERVVKHRREPSPHLGLITVANGLDEQVAQGASLELELAEDVEHLTAERLARLFEFLQQLAIDVAFACFVGH
jgi:hypothetical protein